MSKIVNMNFLISEDQILSNPNDQRLGEIIREIYWEFKSKEEYDSCNVCGKKSPYKISTHIDTRIGYLEGCGQGCFQPNKCK